MEFVHDSEVLGLLKEHGIVPVPIEGAERVYLRMDPTRNAVRVHLATTEASSEPEDGAQVIPVDATDRLPEAVDAIIHRLHLNQILLFPVGKWRQVFDAVAFSLADNEDWQAIDTTATVELNSRDPLLCESGDFHTISALVRALLADAETPEQGLILTTTTAPLVIEIVPEGAVRITFGDQVIADEVAEVLHA